MAGKESLQQEKTGLVEKYKGFNKLTRTGALVFAGGAAVLGFGAAAIGALGVAGVDHAQIKGIEWLQKRKQEKAAKGLAKSGTIVEFKKGQKGQFAKAA
jgi:hypothetical protein